MGKKHTVKNLAELQEKSADEMQLFRTSEEYLEWCAEKDDGLVDPGPYIHDPSDDPVE